MIRNSINKQDVPGAISVTEISDALGLSKLKDRDWSIFKTSAIEGTGLFESLDWYLSS